MKTQKQSGFTLIELIITVVVIGILSTMVIISASRIQAETRNSQREAKLNVLAQALEKYFDKYGQYPACAAMTGSPTTVTNQTLKGMDPSILTAPKGAAGANSILANCADLARGTTSDVFAYVGGVSQYTLKYVDEVTGEIVTLESKHHISSNTYTLTTTARTGGTVTAGGTYTSGAVINIIASANTYYQFSGWSGDTGCTGTNPNLSITLDSNKSCIANFIPIPIDAPATPTINVSTVGATSTWTWSAVTCTGGNSIRYRYDYYVSPSDYDSGEVYTDSTSVSFTTSTEGQTYSLDVQAECYNPATSGLSDTATASYYRPIPLDATLTNNGLASGSAVSFTVNVVPQGVFTLKINNTYGSSNTSSYVTTNASGSANFNAYDYFNGGSITVYNSADQEIGSATISPYQAGTPPAPTMSASMSGSNAVGTAGAVSCGVATTQYQTQTNVNGGTWSAWSAWSSTVPSISVAASQGYKYGFAVHARCHTASSDSASSGTNTAYVVRPINTPPAPTYLSPSSFRASITAVVNYSGSCPSGTSMINKTFRSQAWTGAYYGPHPWGYADSWDWDRSNTSDVNVKYWGKYQCKTSYYTSAYSPEGYHVTVVHPY